VGARRQVCRPARRCRGIDEAADPRRDRAGTGRVRDGVRPVDTGSRDCDVSAGFVPDTRQRRRRWHHVRGVRQRRVCSGARIRRHARRVHRPYEQPCGGCGAGDLGNAARDRTRSRPCDCALQRDRLSSGCCRAGAVPSAGVPSDRPVRAVRRCVSHRQDARARRHGAVLRGRHLWQLRCRSFWSAGWMARSPSSSTPAGPPRAALPPPCSPAPARPGRRESSRGASGCSRRTCRVRDYVDRTSIGSRGGLGTQWESRQRVLQAVPRGARPAPVRGRDPPRAPTSTAFAPRRSPGIDCPVAAFNVPIVCEPVAEKEAPATQAHGRVSLQYTLAEALSTSEALGKQRLSRRYANPDILALARKVQILRRPGLPGARDGSRAPCTSRCATAAPSRKSRSTTAARSRTR
jgi:hypothetical protein